MEKITLCFLLLLIQSYCLVSNTLKQQFTRLSRKTKTQDAFFQVNHSDALTYKDHTSFNLLVR
ncbi:hypothetical protein SCG7109_AU_00110 [Chlamydiales bacterium SCGC AG-110-M15]|nr:hypothetical protein SCG7109_AU_00110 [Chlamydiales bacterium SCGC AG-110-M15]